MKVGRILTTVPIGVWWLQDRIEKAINRKKAKENASALDNLEKLHHLREMGAISEEDFKELKEKLKSRI